MTKETLEFNTDKERKIEIKKRAGIERPLFLDHKDDKFYVTFVTGIDDPDKTPEVEAKRQENKIKRQRRKILQSKLDDDSITFEELKEYLRG